MRTQIFSYKGVIGIQSDVKAEGLLNDPLQSGQLGFVINADYIDIQPEALELLKTVKKSGDDIGEVDVFESEKGVIFSWLGGPLKAFIPDQITGSSTYNAYLLKTTNENIKPPQEFINFVESKV